MFTTKDHDGIHYCANQCKGAWWYNHCLYSNLNSIYSSTAFGHDINWYHWKGHHYSLEFTEMKVCQEGQQLQGRIQGGSWWADDPPFSLKMMASFIKIEPFSLAKLQLLQTFSS